MKNKFNSFIDVTRTVLTPGNHGENCAGNGEHRDETGKLIECCCDGCDYCLECFPEFISKGNIPIV